MATAPQAASEPFTVTAAHRRGKAPPVVACPERRNAAAGHRLTGAGGFDERQLLVEELEPFMLPVRQQMALAVHIEEAMSRSSTPMWHCPGEVRRPVFLDPSVASLVEAPESVL